MLFVVPPLLLLIFALCVWSFLIWLICVLGYFALGLSCLEFSGFLGLIIYFKTHRQLYKINEWIPRWGSERGEWTGRLGFTNIHYWCCWVTSVMSDSVRPHRWQPTRLPRPWDSPGKNTGVRCHFLLQCMKVKIESEVAQSYPTLTDPMDCRLLRPWDFPGKSTGVGCHCLLRIYTTMY